MPASDRFFDQRNAQAVLKHGVLTRYAYYFSGRAGHATDGRVAFIDGYAGEGRYKDGSPGSPLLLASQAQRTTLINRDTKLAFVEPNEQRRDKLNRALADAGVVPDAVLDEPFEAVADSLLERYADCAILLFADPFGLGMSLDVLERVLRASSPRRPIDVLYHFGLLTTARMGRAAVEEGDGSPLAAQLDETLGEVDWRERFAAVEPGTDGAATTAALDVAERFSHVVAQRVGVPSLGIPIRRRPGHLPIYQLTLFTKDPLKRALWDFAEQAGKAHADWLLHCEKSDYDANAEALSAEGVLSLFDDELEPTLARAEDAVRAEAEAYLPDHLLGLIDEKRVFRPVEDIALTYGRLLGRAGEKHLRAALKGLHDEGRIEGFGPGTVRTKELRPTA